ncbi:MAG: hypothetical protein PUF61_10135 [Spirochaetales bacterium]|nr:hypothetical protein [Spirochaetales bacterium]
METINTPLPQRQQTEYFSFCSRLIYNQSSIGKKYRFCGAKPAACVPVAPSAFVQITNSAPSHQAL